MAPLLHKALALTFQGMTDVCAAEIKDLTGIAGKELKEGVLFSTEKLEDVFTICYRSQIVSRVILIVSEGKLNEFSIPKEYLTGTISITGKSSSKAQELAEHIEAKKVYKNADVPFYLHYEDDSCWLGIDLTGDVSKRDYRIFIGSETLTGISSFGALVLSGYEPKHVLLDPFCRAGSIVIEAALNALQMPARYYAKEKLPFVKLFNNAVFVNLFNKKGDVNLFNKSDMEQFFAAQDKAIKERIPGTITALSSQFPSVQASRKNAKIAGVVKAIGFSRTELEWLDMKFEPGSVDRIVTQPVEITVNFPAVKAAKLTTLFFERAKTILKPDGRIGLVLRHGKDAYIAAATEKGFALAHERTIMQGKEAWQVIVFRKSS